MDVLYIAHCVPWPPDKGERIRAFHTVSRLLQDHRVHLACFASSPEEAASQSALRNRLASLRIQVLDKKAAIARGLCRYAAGQCFNTSYYWHPAMQAHIQAMLRTFPIQAAIVLSSPMALYAPDSVPFIADWGDVDSEKWLQYAAARFPGIAQRIEARRLRKIECDYARRSSRTYLVTRNELELFRGIVPDAPLDCSSNGVDFTSFDPQAVMVPDDLRRRKFLAFTGVLNYFPNSDGVCWFAENVFPLLRRQEPELELFLVGRTPSRRVNRLSRQSGITVTGAIDDPRPYLAAARAVIVPLRIARGLQNKVLEGLAMGKHVLASEPVCQTFSPDLPFGILPCRSVEDYLQAVASLPPTAAPDEMIIRATRARFTWEINLDPLVAELNRIERNPMRTRPQLE